MGARVVYRIGREVAAARELGSYRLEESWGKAAWARSGGRGTGCWRGPAAIKLIRPAIAGTRTSRSPRSARRFEREAQVIARLRSPHTVDLFDFGVADNGAFYYVMELLDGMDADTLVRRFGPLPPSASSICSARSVTRCRKPSPAAGASRHQAGEHLPLPLRRGL